MLFNPGILSNTIKNVAAGVLSNQQSAIERTDAWKKDPSTSTWLRDVYQRDLGRDVGEEGLNYWGEEFRGGKSKADIERDIGLSDEKWLQDTYQTELGRGLRDEGRSYWMNDLKGGATRADVLANIKRSDEWKTRNNPTIPDDPEPDDPDPVIPDDPDPVDPGPDWRDIDWTSFSPTLPEYEVNDGIDAAASAGNRMTDHFYMRGLPQNKAYIDRGVLETGAALNYHQGRTYQRDDDGKVIGNKLNIPDYLDPKEMFDYFHDKVYGDDD